MVQCWWRWISTQHKTFPITSAGRLDACKEKRKVTCGAVATLLLLLLLRLYTIFTIIIMMMMIAVAQMFVALLETFCLPGRRANGPLWFHSHGDLCARWTAATCLRVLSIESVRRICSGRFGPFFMQVKKLSRNKHAFFSSFFGSTFFFCHIACWI